MCRRGKVASAGAMLQTMPAGGSGRNLEKGATTLEDLEVSASLLP
jgi:hypothetical protein